MCSFMILKKLITGKKLTDEDLTAELYQICDDVHASCNEECPIYEEVLSERQKKPSVECPYFKDGESMLRILKEVWHHKMKERIDSY